MSVQFSCCKKQNSRGGVAKDRKWNEILGEKHGRRPPGYWQAASARLWRKRGGSGLCQRKRRGGGNKGFWGRAAVASVLETGLINGLLVSWRRTDSQLASQTNGRTDGQSWRRAFLVLIILDSSSGKAATFGQSYGSSANQPTTVRVLRESILPRQKEFHYIRGDSGGGGAGFLLVIRPLFDKRASQ